MSAPVLQTSHTFAPAAASVPDARRFTRAALEEWGLDDVLDDAVLVVSELVTNAITHAGTITTLEVRAEGGGVRLDVEDRHPSRLLPMRSTPSADTDEHGRGLLVTSTLATAWGVEYRPDSKRVWALLGSAERPVARSENGSPTGHPDEVETDVLHSRPSTSTTDFDPLGLRGLALNRLGVDDLLALVVEQARERLAADAAYLLLSHGIDESFTVMATSGLPAEMRGRIINRGEPGSPDATSPLLPLSIEDLERTPVELLTGQGLRSLVVVPVALDGRVIGALATASDLVAGFSSADAALLQRAADWVASAVDRARLRTAELERRGWLSYLAEAGVLLAGSLDPEMTIAMTGQIVVPRLATWCGVYLNDPSGGTHLHHAWHADEQALGSVRAALARTSPADAAASTDPALDGEVTSLPLEVRGQVIGWLTLGRPPGDPLRGELQMIAESIARRAAVAIDNASAHAELQEIGKALQRGLLPASMPSARGIDVGVVYETAGEHNAVGGDFYDFFPLGGGSWFFVVGDVCGTGPEAAAVTGLARHTLRALVRSGFPLGTTLERLNEAILDEGDRGRFLTLVCGTVDPARNGWHRLRLVCAGHPPPFLVSDGRVRRIGRPQPLLGVLDVVEYTEEVHQLQQGNRIVVVTDGVLERREDTRMFEDDGVEAVLASSGQVTAQRAAERLLRSVTEFSETPASDDIAILVLDLHPASRPVPLPS